MIPLKEALLRLVSRRFICSNKAMRRAHSIGIQLADQMQRYSKSTEFHPILIRIVKRCDGDEIRMECGEILRYGISVASMLIWVRGLSCTAGLPFCLSQTIGPSTRVHDMNVDMLVLRSGLYRRRVLPHQGWDWLPCSALFQVNECSRNVHKATYHAVQGCPMRLSV